MAYTLWSKPLLSYVYTAKDIAGSVNDLVNMSAWVLSADTATELDCYRSFH